jgi:hypothetical protein
MKAKTLRFRSSTEVKLPRFDDFSNQDTEPNFDLVHPPVPAVLAQAGSMFGRVMKDNPVAWVAQKISPRSRGLQDTGFAFHAQIDGNV